jgi:hypothetical protein
MENSVKKIELLKEDYFILEKKYALPSFHNLNQEFEIEDLAETETDFLLRGIRKAILEKIGFFSKFIEILVNPGEGSSLFAFSIAKTLSQEDRKKLVEIYERISKFQLDSIKRDLSYLEVEEADFIKKIYFFWEEAKKILLSTLEVINSNWDNKSKKSEKSYFR